MKSFFTALLSVLIFASACSTPGNATKEAMDRKYLIERVDDAAVVQLYADGFNELPKEQKILVYHLAQAAVAGRDIYIDQRYRHSLAIRDLIEEILTHPHGVDAKTLAAVRHYAKLFWVNNGPHNNLTTRKFVLDSSFEAFKTAALRAEKNGAKFSKKADETTEQLLERMRPILFDPNVDVSVTNKSPGEGKDILEASSNNYYEGVSLKDLENFKEKYPLNSKLVKKADGTLEELVWRAGFDDEVAPGMYAKEISQIIRHLEAAIPYATPEMARALGSLIHFYRTGEPADFREYNVAWVADKNSPVDTINGFIEVYVDARGQKGGWESVVYFNDPEKMNQIQKFSENAQWFEDHMPYDPQYRKPKVKGISAKAIQVVMETGDSGPITPIGINLPNPDDIREHYGSKSVSLGNVVDAYDKSTPSESRSEFCYDKAEFERLDKWDSLTSALKVNMHEVIGHASGRVTPDRNIEPVKLIKEYYSALEEARADLVALYFLGNPKLKELGLVSDPDEAMLAGYESYTRNALTQLNRMKQGDQLEEDHMRNRQMVVHWIMANTKAIQVKQRDGKTFYTVVDPKEWQRGSGLLLAEVQRVKSEGDYEGAKKLFDNYGIKFDTKLRDEVVARYKKLNRPAYVGFVMPKLTPVKNKEGEIVDVTISYPFDLETQMLEWSGRKG